MFSFLWNEAAKIPGWYLREEAELLYWAALRPSEFPILEVGCYAGRSTRVLAEAALQKGVQLWVIDSFTHNHPIEGVDPESSAKKVLYASNCGWSLLKMRTSEIKEGALPSMGFIHIDDSHQTVDLEVDRKKVLPLLVSGGFAAFHDYCPEWPDVPKFVDSLGWKVVARIRSLIILEKP